MTSARIMLRGILVIVAFLVSLGFTSGRAPAPLHHVPKIVGGWTVLYGRDLPHEDPVVDRYYHFDKDGRCEWTGSGSWQQRKATWTMEGVAIHVRTVDPRGWPGEEVWRLKRVSGGCLEGTLEWNDDRGWSSRNCRVKWVPE